MPEQARASGAGKPTRGSDRVLGQRQQLTLAAGEFGNGDCDVLCQTVGGEGEPATPTRIDGAGTTRADLVREVERLRRRLVDLEEARSRLERAEAALRESEGRYRVVVEHANDGIVVAQEGIIKFVNRKVTEVSGYSKHELLSRPFAEFIHPEDREVVVMRHQIGMQGRPGPGLIYPVRVISRSGAVVWVEINPVAMTWEGAPATLSLLSDITERKRAERTIMHLAYHDALTGLPNRMLFNDRLSVALSHAERNRTKIGLLLLDLDGFKEINDTYGHTVGDELLRRTGDRVRALLRKADTVARMGGDEFMLLLPSISRLEDTSGIADKVLEAIAQPVPLTGRVLHITASVGSAVFPDDGEDVDTLMRNVDQAMYRAKTTGRGKHCMFRRQVAAAPPNDTADP